MKKLFSIALTGLIFGLVAMVSCRKNGIIIPPPPSWETLQPRYTPMSEFQQGIQDAVNLLGRYNVPAFLDTLPNGYPNIQGRKIPLIQIGSLILEKLHGNSQQVESAVYDIFHFDGATFSLISYIRKAQMTGNISAQTAAEILALIPVPPIPVANFEAPVEMVALNLRGGDCCKDNQCAPKINILVTWVHVAPCGNYAKGTSGHAARNTLTNMSSGQSYRFTPEISGCPCPGVLTHTVTTPAGASFGEGTTKDGSVDLLPVSSGTYTVTFTYVVCGITVSKTFTLGVK